MTAEVISQPDKLPEAFQTCATWVVQIFQDEFQIQLGYDLEAVEQLSNYIEQIRPLITAEGRGDTIAMLGAFLGECVVQTCGGSWVEQNGWWGVQLAEGVVACPFVQVENQLSYGAEQSVTRYFRCLANLSDWLTEPVPSDNDMIVPFRKTA